MAGGLAPWDILYPNGDFLPFEPGWQDHKLVSMEKAESTLEEKALAKKGVPAVTSPREHVGNNQLG